MCVPELFINCPTQAAAAVEEQQEEEESEDMAELQQRLNAVRT